MGVESGVNVVRDHFNEPYVTARLAHISEIYAFLQVCSVLYLDFYKQKKNYKAMRKASLLTPSCRFFL